MGEPNERLRQARKAKFTSARAAALRHGWKPSTYASHENGQTPLGAAAAKLYAKAFKVSASWLLYGSESKEDEHAAEVPVVGYVGAGAATHFFSEAQGPFDEVPAPPDADASTVAVEVRGESLGSFFDRWVVYYNDIRRPVTADLIGKLCVLGLSDGRVLIKKLKRGQRRGRFDLLSNVEPPIYDVSIDWAARVLSMAPK